MEEFDDLQDALDFTAMNLIPRRHSYIVDISSVEEAGSERNCNLQIVPEHFVIEGGSYGLTVHLPFNRSSEKFAALSQLLKSNLAETAFGTALGRLGLVAAVVALDNVAILMKRHREVAELAHFDMAAARAQEIRRESSTIEQQDDLAALIMRIAARPDLAGHVSFFLDTLDDAPPAPPPTSTPF